jgi:hypothetical protein
MSPPTQRQTLFTQNGHEVGHEETELQLIGSPISLPQMGVLVILATGQKYPGGAITLPRSCDGEGKLIRFAPVTLA